jgi:multiple sugar transport system permease protein
MIMNSFIIGFSAAGLSLLIGTLTAYAMSRYHFRWRRDLAVWILSTRFFPAFATAIPLYFMFVNLGLLNNRFGLALVYAGMDLPFVVWNMKAFFDEVPFELDESALLDGCTRIGALFRVALPLAMAGLVATGIFCVIINWNEFAFGLILTSTAVAEPVTVGAGAMMGRRGIEWNGMLAGGVVAILPVVVFALIVQKYLVRGLTFGAVKGR